MAPGRWVPIAVRLALLAFLIVCVFDPTDLMLRLKVPLFVALWILTLAGALVSGPHKLLLAGNSPRLLAELAIYVAIFAMVPLLSIVFYHWTDGRQPFEGYLLFKGYLLVSLALVLFVNRIDLLPQLAGVLTALSICIISVFILLLFNPALFGWIKEVAEPTGLLFLDKRPYGRGITLLQVYFVTSPMLLIAIAYFFDQAMTAENPGRRIALAVTTVINLAGMFLAGSRNNIFASLLLVFLLWPIYTRKPLLYLTCSLGGLVGLALPFTGYLVAFLDPQEFSNNVKIATIFDYFSILRDPVTLLFGQGLGAYQVWSAKQTSFVTELTYFEMIRSFGLLGTFPLMTLLLLPAEHAFAGTRRREYSFAIAWLLYLATCFSNPNLFSSMGLLIFSILLANVFLESQRDAEGLVWAVPHANRP